MKTFKARITPTGGTFHAMEVWFTASNILEAGEILMTYFDAIGIEKSDVTMLIEIPEDRSK